MAVVIYHALPTALSRPSLIPSIARIDQVLAQV